jgi:predicted RNA binding protein YcfA (HicA-like mRNA interferase family)
VPRKIRQLIADLKKAGFVDRGGKGSHRNFTHSTGARCTLSGKEGADAKHYQEKEVKDAIHTSKHEKDRS